MTKRTRYFLTGSALVLLLGLGTGLVAYYKGDLPLFKARIGPSELAYVPATASGLAFANVRDIMNSEFHQKLRAAMPTGGGKEEFFNETGIDVERDIQSVLAATFVADSTSSDAGPGLVLIRGSFDTGRIEALIRQHNGTVDEYHGARLMVVRRPGDAVDSHGMCLTFPEGGLAMLGSEPRVKAAIDTHASHQDVSGNADLMKLVSQMDNGYNTAWAVGGLEALAANPNLPPQVRAQLPAIRWVAVGAHINGGVNGQVRAEAKDQKSAEDLRSVVSGAIAAGRLVGGNAKNVDTLMNSLQVSGSGNDVELSFSIPSEMVDMMSGFMGAKQRRGDATQKPSTDK